MSRRKSGLNFYKKERRLNKNLVTQIFSFTFITIAACLLAFVFIFCFGIKTGVIGVSMEPTLSSGEEIFINRFIYFLSNPQSDDVIVFLPNGNENSHFYVKRVIACPGDTIEISNGIIYVNDSVYEEQGKYDKIEDGGIATNAITLGDEEYFVLGDNRNSSEDSRSGNIGLVKKEYIIGKAWFYYDKNKAKEDRLGFIK